MFLGIKWHVSWQMWLVFFFLRFMDEIQEQIDGIEEDAEIVRDLYALVDQYQVPVNPEDLAIYQVIIIIV